MTDEAPIPQELLLLPEAADVLRVSSRTMRRLIATGALPAIRVGGQLRIERSDLNAYVARHRTVGQAA